MILLLSTTDVPKTMLVQQVMCVLNANSGKGHQTRLQLLIANY